MKNGKYTKYSRIFHTFAWGKISCRISLPHYAVLPYVIHIIPPGIFQSHICRQYYRKIAQNREAETFFRLRGKVFPIFTTTKIIMDML